MSQMVGMRTFADIRFECAAADALGDDDEDTPSADHMAESKSAAAAEESRVVFAHKAVLMQRSTHLRAMLASGMREAQQQMVRLPHIPRPVLLALLHWLYHGHFPDDNPALLLPLLRTASEWQLTSLMRRCEGILLSAVDVENCASLLSLAEAHFLSYFKSALMAFVHRNWQQFQASEGFKQLSPTLRAELRRQTHGSTYAYRQDRQLELTQRSDENTPVLEPHPGSGR